jgi:hypothetical protein
MNMPTFQSASRFGRSMAFVVFCAAAFVAGCGGGSGDAPAAPVGTSGGGISGVAAVGNPITPSMNGVVALKDSSSPAKTLSTATDATGAYSFSAAQLAGTTAPYMLEISYQLGGVSYWLHSAATAADVSASATINITPLTDLVIANLAGDIARNVFNNGNFSATLTASALRAGASALAAQLKPILLAQGVDAAVDLLHQSFTANGTGLDAVLDSLSITVDAVTKTAVIINRLNNQSITNSLITANTAVLGATGGVPLTDLMGISSTFNALATLMATVPTASNTTLMSYFDQGKFVDSGKSLPAFLQDITGSPTVGGGFLRFSDIVLSDAPAYASASVPSSAQAAYLVRFTVLQNTAATDRHEFVMYKSSAGLWLILGDQKLAKAAVTALEVSGLAYNGSTTIRTMCTGLNLNVNDKGGNSLSYAVVTGAGLPANGVLLFNKANDSFFIASGDVTTYAGASTPSAPSSQCQFSSIYALSDANISSIAAVGEVYTIKIYKDNGTPSNRSDDVLFATYTSRLEARPLTSAQLNASFFTSNASASPALLTAAATGATSNITWTAPTAANMFASNVFIYISASGNSASQSADRDVAPTATSVSLAIPKTVNAVSASVTTEYVDGSFRGFWTGY